MGPSRRRWILLVALALAAGAALLSLGPRTGAPPPEHDATPAADSPTPIAPPLGTEAPEETATRVLRGTVRAAEDGSPIAGARVSVYYFVPLGGTRMQERESDPVETAPDGSFSLGSPAGKRTLAVAAPGFAGLNLELPDALDSVDVRLDRAARVTGRVLDASRRAPVAGTTVYAVNGTLRDWNLDCTSARTDDEGRFELAGVRPGETIFVVCGGGHVSLGLAREAGPVPVAPGETLEVELLAEPSARLTGRVVDHDGRPARARVTAWTQAHGAWPRVETDGAGRFEIDDVVPGIRHTVSAYIEGRADGRVGPVIARSGKTVEVEIRMPAPRFIDVVVTDRESGEPVAGARIEVKPGKWRWSDEFKTGEDGRVRLGPLDPTALNIKAEHPEYVPQDDWVRVAADHSGEVRIRLAPGLPVSGTVVLPDGTPLDDGYVEAGGRDGLVEKGRFRLSGLPPGPVVVEVYADSEDPRGEWEGTAHARAGESGIVVRLEPVEDEYALPEEEPFVVRVVGVDGEPVPSAWAVVAAGPDDERSATILLGRGEASCPVDRQSVLVEVYDARSASGAPLPLGATLAGPFPGSVDEAVVRLPPERSIAGTVRDDANAGVAGVQVSAKPVEPKGIDKSPHRTVRTGPDGSFRIGGLWKGTYQVEAEAPEGFVTRKVGATVESGTEGVELTLRRALAGRLALVDPDGRPVAGAEVELCLIPENGQYRRYGGPTGISDADGVVELTGLVASGRYLVIGSPPERRSDLLEMSWWDVRPGDRLTFDRALHVTATVPDADGEEVVVWGREVEHGSWEEGRISGEGVFTVGPFRAGDVALVALERGVMPQRWGGLPTVVPAGATGVRLPFDAGHDLVVRVSDWPGGEEARGTLTIEGSGVAHGVKSEVGVFRFWGLPKSRPFTFWAGPVAGDRYAYRTGIGADEREVTIALERGRTVTGRVVTRTEMPGSVGLGGPGFDLRAEVAPDGTFEFRGVPPGTWNVTASCCVTHEGRHRHSHGSGVAEPGKPVVLEMSDPQ